MALSGGVDSTVLTLAAYNALGSDMIAITGDSDSLPIGERKFVARFCERYSIPHRFIKTREFGLEEYRRNSEERCYYCKRELLGTLVSYAGKNGYRFVLDGTNTSDLSGHRPGYRAIKEIEGVATPYIDLGITKEEIRQIAAQFGLIVADKPASACLASRIPWGSRIEPEALHLVDRAEDILRDMGFTQVRVRHHGYLARVQCVENELSLALELRRKISAELRELGYKYVTFDLMCYGEVKS